MLFSEEQWDASWLFFLRNHIYFCSILWGSGVSVMHRLTNGSPHNECETLITCHRHWCNGGASWIAFSVFPWHNLSNETPRNRCLRIYSKINAYASFLDTSELLSMEFALWDITTEASLTVHLSSNMCYEIFHGVELCRIILSLGITSPALSTAKAFAWCCFSHFMFL